MTSAIRRELDKGGFGENSVEIVNVDLTGSYPNTFVEVLFTDARGRKKVFGIRDPVWVGWHRIETPEQRAVQLWIEIVEVVDTDPRFSEEGDGITWISD